MSNILEKKDLITFLNLEKPSIEDNGINYTFYSTENTQLSYGDLDTNCVLIEFISSKILKYINLKKVANILTQRINELVNKDMFTIFSTHNFGDRIFLYVDFKNLVSDVIEEKNAQSVENIVLEKIEQSVENLVLEKDEAVFGEATKNYYDEFKFKLRDNVIFEKVRNYIWLSSKPQGYPEEIWNDSFVYLKIQIRLEGFNMDDDSLKELYVKFCCEFGFTRDDIDKEFKLRTKSKAVKDVMYLDKGGNYANYAFETHIYNLIDAIHNAVIANPSV